MNNRTEAKLKDLSGMQKEVSELLYQAWKRGYKYCEVDHEERPQGEWIPVSERLPEEKINPYTTDFDEVLCTTDWGEVRAFKFGTPILHHEPHFWLGGAIMDEHIIAWQYKPEPYQKGGAV